MICSNCQHQNDGGNFCENCGARLAAADPPAAGHAVSAALPAQTSEQKSVYLEKTKDISKMYFHYFLSVIKAPFGSSSAAGSSQFINGVITIILYALLIPLIYYFFLKGMLSEMNSIGSDIFGSEAKIELSFAEYVIKPALVYGVFILLVTSFSFFAVLMGRNQITFKESIGRFGSMLIPFTAMLAISLLFILMNSGEFSFYFFLAGFAGSILLVPPLFISSYFRETSKGLDPLYGSLIVYILTGILFKVMGEMMFETISKSLEQIVTFFGLF